MYCYLKPLGVKLNSIHPLGFHVCPMLCQACAAPSMISPVAAVEATVFVGWVSSFSATLQFGDFEYFGTLKNSICKVLISNQIAGAVNRSGCCFLVRLQFPQDLCLELRQFLSGALHSGGTLHLTFRGPKSQREAGVVVILL